MAGKLLVVIEGPDAEQAFAELQSNIQYDDLNVTVKRMDDLPDTLASLRARLEGVLETLDKRTDL